jgi:phosphinothricin acetyltransferase
MRTVNEPFVRPATQDDLPAVNAIFNHYVLHSTCIWVSEPETPEGRQTWLAAHDEHHPVTVVEEGGVVVGWASLSAFNSRSGWRHTVEDSIYVRQDRLGRGLGSRLLADLLDRATRLGHHIVVAAICADQPASVRLHLRHGFVECGRLRETGFKFGRWLDAVYLQKTLAPGGRNRTNPGDTERIEGDPG